MDALPIQVAEGRKQFQPNIGFLYGSSGTNAELGVGFALETGHIQRSPARGIPGGSQVDEFIFSLAGSSDVLLPQGAGAYRPRFETAFRQYQFLGDHWEVKDAQGTLYVFGSSARVDGLLWMLEQVKGAAAVAGIAALISGSKGERGPGSTSSTTEPLTTYPAAP